LYKLFFEAHAKILFYLILKHFDFFPWSRIYQL
jgi:hypothetical protein